MTLVSIVSKYNVPNYSVDIASLQEHFPPHFAIPSLLIEFADWLQQKPWGSVGCFQLMSERWDDSWGENSGDLYLQFAPFLRSPTGSVVSLWLPEGKSDAGPSVVYLGSEGELALAGTSLGEFLICLAQRKSVDEDLNARDDRCEDLSAALLEWLEPRVSYQSAPVMFNVKQELTAEPHLPGFKVTVAALFE